MDGVVLGRDAHRAAGDRSRRGQGRCHRPDCRQEAPSRPARRRATRGNSERLTPLGAFLRASSIDELPELFNVLKGDMSLVGPRPLRTDYLPRYSAEQARRHDVLPGITGWAQINGRNSISWEEKFRLDVWYVDNRNLFLDVKILFQTFLKVFKREGISAEGHATMPDFMGSGDKSSQDGVGEAAAEREKVELR